MHRFKGKETEKTDSQTAIYLAANEFSRLKAGDGYDDVEIWKRRDFNVAILWNEVHRQRLFMERMKESVLNPCISPAKPTIKQDIIDCYEDLIHELDIVEHENLITNRFKEIINTVLDTIFKTIESYSDSKEKPNTSDLRIIFDVDVSYEIGLSFTIFLNGQIANLTIFQNYFFKRSKTDKLRLLFRLGESTDSFLKGTINKTTKLQVFEFSSTNIEKCIVTLLSLDK